MMEKKMGGAMIREEMPSEPIGGKAQTASSTRR